MYLNEWKHFHSQFLLPLQHLSFLFSFIYLFIYLFIHICLLFCLLSHSKIIRSIVKSLITTSTYFLLKQLRKRENCFLGTRVWAPKLVYQSPKWPGCITKNSVQLLDAAPNNLFFQKLILSKTVCICYKHRGCSNQRYLLQILTVKMCPYISLPDVAFNF